MNTYWSIEQLLSEELLVSTEFSNNSKYLEQEQEQEQENEEDDDQEGDEGSNTVWCCGRTIANESWVMCDNRECQKKWFHFSCVNLKKEPKGEWYCFECRQSKYVNRSGTHLERNELMVHKNTKADLELWIVAFLSRAQLIKVTLPFQYLPNTLRDFQNSSPVLVQFDPKENSYLKLHYYYLGSYLSDLLKNRSLSSQLSQLFVRRFSNLVSLSQREIKLIYNRYKQSLVFVSRNKKGIGWDLMLPEKIHRIVKKLDRLEWIIFGLVLTNKYSLQRYNYKSTRKSNRFYQFSQSSVKSNTNTKTNKNTNTKTKTNKNTKTNRNRKRNIIGNQKMPNTNTNTRNTNTRYKKRNTIKNKQNTRSKSKRKRIKKK
ncbi:chromatin modification-related protein yng2 [Anaeramoeba flamelloides]|uniref:Chromatin modification-related protein yng2 n=1 Tax=Anaeramoeba flamelloides TaxID=1746091 RepID=A0ABQ8YLH1_9EUKA|nr:chromatin modification-related protein yng2 [Anaeramoeba flamelloides]